MKLRSGCSTLFNLERTAEMAMAAITLTKRIEYRYAKSILEDVVFDVVALLMSGSENFRSISEQPQSGKRSLSSQVPPALSMPPSHES